MIPHALIIYSTLQKNGVAQLYILIKSTIVQA